MDEISFPKQVYSIVGKIPLGQVISYGQIAHILGRPRAAREVGWAMSRCPDDLPWQRVVMSDGSISGGECASVRRALLKAEGVPFLSDGRVDISACCWQYEAERSLTTADMP
jgi:methylated-DNA-protein-cysteine methyltransferase-like protein